MIFKNLNWYEKYFKGELSGYEAIINIPFVKSISFTISIPAINYDDKYYYSYYINDQLQADFILCTMEEAKEKANIKYQSIMSKIFNGINDLIEK
jgi:hypothetical protein